MLFEIYVDANSTLEMNSRSAPCEWNNEGMTYTWPAEQPIVQLLLDNLDGGHI